MSERLVLYLNYYILLFPCGAQMTTEMILVSLEFGWFHYIWVLRMFIHFATVLKSPYGFLLVDFHLLF